MRTGMGEGGEWVSLRIQNSAVGHSESGMTHQSAPGIKT
jgi:hypothetical protein